MTTNEQVNLPVGWIIQPNPETKKTGYQYPNGIRVFQYENFSAEEIAILFCVHAGITPKNTRPPVDEAEHNG